MRIDAHQHFWRYDPGEFPWIDARMQAIARDFLPAHLAPELAAAGVDASIAVQARQSLAETHFLLALAHAHPAIVGVVGWVDLRAPDVDDALADLCRDPLLRGVRHVVQDEPDDAFLQRSDFQRGVRALARHGLVYDVLIYPRQLASADAFVAALQGQPFVLDHLAKPDLKNGRLAAWQPGFRALARHANVACKLSGLVTEAAWHAWRAVDLRRCLDSALDAFGPERLLFGSDWPVCLLAARDYREVYDVVANWAERLSPGERDGLFGGNAARIYRIP